GRRCLAHDRLLSHQVAFLTPAQSCRTSRSLKVRCSQTSWSLTHEMVLHFRTPLTRLYDCASINVLRKRSRATEARQWWRPASCRRTALGPWPVVAALPWSCRSPLVHSWSFIRPPSIPPV